MTKQWAAVPDYTGLYEVSDTGELRSVARVTTRLSQAGNQHVMHVAARRTPTYANSRTGHLYASLYTPGVGNKRVKVHRIVLRAFVGEPPQGTEGCHRNGNPVDNRVDNLYWGTRSDNMQDMIRHGRRAPLADRCGRGHLFDGANTRICPSGYRACRTCDRDRAREKYQLSREAQRLERVL